MKLGVEKKVIGRELMGVNIDIDDFMFMIFSEMWKKLDKKLSKKDIDSLGLESEITFSIEWEG